MPESLRALPLFSGPPLGVGMFAAALILAVMVVPFTSSIAREVLKTVPVTQREAAYALGATRFEAIRAAMFFARTGIIGAVMLGFGRALGETMAVTMVIGNNPQVSLSLFAPQYTMAAVIANEFTEAADALYLSRADRNRPRALHHHAARQRAVALPDLVDGAPGVPIDRVGPLRARRDDRGTPRKVLSALFVGACAPVRAAGAGPTRVRAVLRGQPGHPVAQSAISSRTSRARSANPAAAWPTPSSAR